MAIPSPVSRREEYTQLLGTACRITGRSTDDMLDGLKAQRMWAFGAVVEAAWRMAKQALLPPPETVCTSKNIRQVGQRTMEILVRQGPWLEWVWVDWPE